VALNRPLDEATARQIGDNKQFVEVLIAPAITPEARAIFAAKQNVRLLEVPLGAAANAWTSSAWAAACCCRRPTPRTSRAAELRVVTTKAPTEAQIDDLLFAWKVAKFVKSNAIVFCGGGMTLGVGAGQMSRIDSARIARIKAGNAGLSLAGSAVASDAFFPFRDGLDVVIDEGAACVIQPGGSMRDDEVIAAADERGIAMVFTGTRHFRH
jgi:phosphoribosylaminoimidazolecarboxamide formyltransferase/IMP cyclohydrolase